MRKILHSYVRPYRLRWGLTQRELAYLAGVRTREYISRLESRHPDPKLSVAFALHVVFGAESIELFPALFSHTEDAVITRAYDLYERLQGNSSKATRIKLDFLEEMFERARRRDAHDAAV